MLWAFSLVCHLKGLCSFVLHLRLLNADLVSVTSVLINLIISSLLEVLFIAGRFFLGHSNHKMLYIFS